ncbi:Cytochrome P450, partial [Dillenia turbinata]
PTTLLIAVKGIRVHLANQKAKINRSSHSKRFERNRENMDFLILVIWFLLSWILIQAFLFATIARNSSPKRPPLPPGPFPYPIVGSLFNLGNKPHKSLTKLAKIHGPIMSLRLGQITTIVISSPTLAKEVLQTNDLYFSYRAIPDCMTAHDYHLHAMVWLPPLNKWRNQRKITNSHIFATQKLDANQHLRQKKVEEMLQYVQECSQAGVAINIGLAAFVTSLNLLSNTAFSVDLVNPSSDSAQELKELVWSVLEEGGKPNSSDYFPVFRHVDPQGIRRRTRDLFGKMFEIFESFIEQRLQSRKATVSAPTPSIDVLDTLLDLIQQDQDIDRTTIVHLFSTLFIAGTDTTSSTIEWAMAEILRNPITLSKVQAELEHVIGKGNLFQESDIANLPYLQATVKETLRLHPPAPFLIPRTVEKDEEIRGLLVPKKAHVLVNVWAISRDPSIWDNPDSFVPERFLDADIEFRGRNFEFIPFGAGRRICPGLPLAIRMAHLMLGSLLHTFKWKLEDGVGGSEGIDMDDKFGITLQKSKPLLVVPIKL